MQGWTPSTHPNEGVWGDMILIFASKYSLGVNDNKHTFTPRQYSSVFTQDFGHVSEASAAPAQLAGFHA